MKRRAARRIPAVLRKTLSCGFSHEGLRLFAILEQHGQTGKIARTVLWPPSLIQHVHFGLRLPERDARFQSCQHPYGVVPIRLLDIGPIPYPRPCIRTRRHADDGLRSAVHEDPLTQNCRVAIEPPVSGAPVHHHHAGIAARRDIFRSSQTPDGGLESEHLEIVSQDALEDEGLGFGSFSHEPDFRMSCQ
jgi:hypothetical protein